MGSAAKSVPNYPRRFMGLYPHQGLPVTTVTQQASSAETRAVGGASGASPPLIGFAVPFLETSVGIT